MPSLFIIGNGFDLAHGLSTRYCCFHRFLIEKYSANADIPLVAPDNIMGNHGEEEPNSTEAASLVAHLLAEAEVDDLWSDFEEKLGSLDYDEFFDFCEDYDRNGEENFWHTAYNMEDVSSSLLRSIPYIQMLFREWIETIRISPRIPLKEPFRKIISPESDFFLNFNYTSTLETLYGCKNVCHIHGRQGGEILVGHGDDSEEVGCFDDAGYPGAMCNLTDVKRALRKNTKKALDGNQDFFRSLSTVEKVYSIGFSYSDVDLVYIREICNRINANSLVWTFNDWKEDRNKFPTYRKDILKCGYIGKFDIANLI